MEHAQKLGICVGDGTPARTNTANNNTFVSFILYESYEWFHIVTPASMIVNNKNCHSIQSPFCVSRPFDNLNILTADWSRGTTQRLAARKRMKSGIQVVTLANSVKRTWVQVASERSDVDEGNVYSNRANVPLQQVQPTGPLLQAPYASPIFLVE